MNAIETSPHTRRDAEKSARLTRAGQAMNVRVRQMNEFESGDLVEPGEYLDLDTGAIVKVQERDELPTGHKEISFTRRFRRIDSFTASRIVEAEQPV
jgi:hypothetical protein